MVATAVSQVDYGVLHLVNRRNPQITVLVDCEGLTSLRFPMQMLRSCSALLQDNFPNLLGCLFVIRLPPVARVIAQTFIQVRFLFIGKMISVFYIEAHSPHPSFSMHLYFFVNESFPHLPKVLKPVTRQKLNIIGGMYQKVLYEHLQTIPSYLGGICTCTTCVNIWSMQPRTNEETNNEQRNVDNASSEDLASLHPSTRDNMYMDGNCDQFLRSAIVGILIFSVLIALIMGIYDPESRPVLYPMR